MLFFFAGYEIDIQRIRGRPLRLALFGWAMSLAIAYGLGGVLAAVGIVVFRWCMSARRWRPPRSGVRCCRCSSDTGELDSEFSTYLLAAGAVGEFGPVLLLTLVLSTQSPAPQRGDPGRVRRPGGGGGGRGGPIIRPHVPLFERTIERARSSRCDGSSCWCSRSALLASDLGLDLLLGGFAAGLITRLVCATRGSGFDSKLTAVAFGVFIPFFFVVSGMRLDIDALFASPSGVGKLLLFFVLFLVVRGTRR